MNVVLCERTRDNVIQYFYKTNNESIRRTLPQTVATVEEALVAFEATRLPGATSFGRTIYVDGVYVGDVWCYGIDPTEEPQAMLSYCVFEPAYQNRGVATAALRAFLSEILDRYSLRSVGAFCYADHIASLRVLEKNGFTVKEHFEENGIASVFLQYDRR